MKKLNTDSNTRTIGLDKTQFKEHIMSIKGKVKVAGFASTITALVCASIPVSYASDIEIYKVPEDSTGSTTLMMLLDISGSMDACDRPSGVSGTVRTESKEVVHNGFTTSYNRKFCANKKDETRYYFMRTGSNTATYKYFSCSSSDSLVYTTNKSSSDCANSVSTAPTGYSSSGSSPLYYYIKTSVETSDRYYQRITKLQDAMMSMLNGDARTTKLADNIVIGLSTLGRVSTGTYDTGRVVVPARPLSDIVDATTNQTQRDLLIQEVAKFDSSSYTPTGRSYAEAAAYLLGTNTLHNKQDTSDYTDGIAAGYTSYPVGSGFLFSADSAKVADGTFYEPPASIKKQLGETGTAKAARECSGQGIYVLTDGAPNNPNYMKDVMQKSLTTSTFSTDLNCVNGWDCIKKYSQYLKDPTKNPSGLEFRTAVVGFGPDFKNESATGDVAQAKIWGELGKGGWYVGDDAQSVVKSVDKFVKELNKDIPSMSTGSSTIPTDALNPAALQKFSYFPQFEPKVNPVDTQQIWFGNLKKYYVLNNGVYSSEIADTNKIVVKESKLQDLDDIWAKPGISYDENAPLYKKGGVLSQLPVGVSVAGTETATARNLFTDYSYDGTKDDGERIGRDLNLVKIKYTYTQDANTKTDTTYAKALMGLLGYDIADDTDTNGLDLTSEAASIRQMGAIMHSNPILLTQAGKAVASKNASGKISVGSTDRSDYVLFGTTQGLVQVVDADTGVEKFAFAPKEIIERQSETFKNNGGNLSGGKESLYYGMDGEWTAHTIYVTKSDGTLTVKGTARDVADSEEKENLSGKQWVYGGMRMGGRSYYSLDLTNIDSPKIKFHIDPSTGKVYSKANPEGKTFDAISNMGQSWSKPTLGYVNWKGKRKLVMFVGGGYDAGGTNGDGQYINGIRSGYTGYENYNYNQSNSIGAGVYMFDADNGDLLWNTDSTTNTALVYSVAGPIRAVDRNNDGIVDHLYFGDLAGQAFRVDLKNDGASTYTAKATKILDLHKINGTSPRFYTLPVFTAHRSAGKTEGGNIVVATFVSGNKSSPLLASNDSPLISGKRSSDGLEFDGVYAVYDYDVYPSTDEGRYPSSVMGARKLATVTETIAASTKLKYINDSTTGAQINKTSGWGGWYYLFKKKFNDAEAGASIIKALTNPIAMEGNLYLTQFDSSDNGTTSSCGAGVKGNSFAEQLCLPTGVCKTDAKYRYNLGSGIVTLNVGGDDADPYKRSLVVPDPNDVGDGCVGTACTTGKKFLTTGGALKFIPHRWYEKYASNSP